MGSSDYRMRGTDLVARCCHGVFYAVGFLTTTLIFMAMLWILWCYFGLAWVQLSDGQRRAVVHYSPTSAKPQDSSTAVLPNQGEDALKSIPKSVTTSSSFLRGSSRGESQLKFGHERIDSSGGSNAMAKGDFAARDTLAPGPKDPPTDSIHLPELKAEGGISSDDDDGIQVRRVATSNDNRYDSSEPSKDKDVKGNVENLKVNNPTVSTLDAKSTGAPSLARNITSSREYHLSERRDEIQSSRSSDVDATHHDLASDTDSPHSPDGTKMVVDDDRGSRSRYETRYRGRDKERGTDDSYSKGDTRLHDKTVDEELHSHGEKSDAVHPEDHRRRGDDDRYLDYDDGYKSRADRHRYRDDSYRTYEGRYRVRDDERYTSSDDDRYRSQDEERYRKKDSEDGSIKRDRLRDHGRDTSRVDDRYSARDTDRSRVDDRYISRDDDEDRVRPDDRYSDDDRGRYRDEGRYRTRYRDSDRSRYGDNYRSRDGYRDRSTEDISSERGSQSTRYLDRDGYRVRGDEDRYRDDTRTKGRDYRDPVMTSRDDDYPPRASSAGSSNLEVPLRTSLSESRYKNTDRDDGYKRPSRYEDRDRISPTRVKDDAYSSRTTLMDSRSKSVLTDSRRMDDDRLSQGSRRYQDDSRKEYRTRMPNENTKYVPRNEDDSTLERRSYGSEEDAGYPSRTRYYDDRSGTRRYFSNRDEEYSSRSRPKDGEEYSRRRTDDDEEYSPRRASDDEEYPRRRTSDDEEYPRRRASDDEEYPSRRADYDEEYSRRRASDEEEYPRRRTDDGEFRRSRPSEYYDSSRSRYRDRYEGYSRDDDRYDDDRTRRYDDRPRRQDVSDHRKEVGRDILTGDRPLRGLEDIDTRDSPKRVAPDSSRRDDADGSLSEERPLSAKEVIEAALRQSDLPDKNPLRKVSYPVFDPRVSNLTSPDIIRPSERRGITIHSRKKRRLGV